MFVAYAYCVLCRYWLLPLAYRSFRKLLMDVLVSNYVWLRNLNNDAV